MMQVGESAVDERAHEIQGERGTLVAAQQELRIGLALLGGEPRPVDVVAPVRGQRHAGPRFGVRGAGLRVLPGESPDANDGLLQALQQHQTHLQQDLQALGDVVGLAVLETLRAITALQQELLAALRTREPGSQAPRSPRIRRAAAGGSTKRPPARARSDRCTSAAGSPRGSASSPGASSSSWRDLDMSRCYTARTQCAKPGRRCPGGASSAGTAECRPPSVTESPHVQSPRHSESPRAR